jgi:RNA polymerase sigma-70 factor (ECF subfamily)
VTRRDESFCLDVVQDAVLRVIRTVKPVDCESRFRGWLRLVVQTTAFDLLRSERRRKNREAMAGPVADEVDVDSLQLDWLEQQISSLDPELVKIIELRFEQNWTLRRIGEKLGLSVGAVDGRLRRALKNLQLSADEPALPVFDIETVEVPMVVASVEPALAEPHDILSPELAALELSAAVTTPAVDAVILERIEPAAQLDVVSPEVEVAMPIRSAARRAVSVMAVAPVEIVAVDVIEQTDWPELVGLEDEAGWYDDAL